MIVSINQPAYLPWLGYFQRIAVSDLHIVLDHVQFEKNGFTNRNKIRILTGSCWLTIPIKTKGRFHDLGIDTVEIENSTNWRSKHWETIRHNYCKSVWFSNYAPSFLNIYQTEWVGLAALCQEVTGHLLQQLCIRTSLLRSSEMGVEGTKDELVLNLCREVGATTYLSGALGRNYLREDRFRSAGIKVAYQSYHHPTYPQAYPGFEPFLSAIDLLFNSGPDSLNVLTRDQEVIGT